MYSQSQLLERDVFLVERIEAVESSQNAGATGLSDVSSSSSSAPRVERMKHLNAVCFIRPTDKNFMLLAKLVKTPVYAEYNLFFTNCIPHNRLEQLAFADELEVVVQVKEVFTDVYAITDDVYSLNLPSTIRMCSLPAVQWSPYEQSIYRRHVDGLFSLLVSMQTTTHGFRPFVRYSRTSLVGSKVGSDLAGKVLEEQTLFDAPNMSSLLVLVLDRREDPVTPLLNQWTYQAMLHELIGIENNRIDMRKTGSNSNEQQSEIAMSTLTDPFYHENLYHNFGDLGCNIKAYVSEFQDKTRNSTKIDTIDDMQRFVENYPEFRKLSGNVSKHVGVVHELSRLVQESGLLEISKIEQDLACTENRQDHFTQVLQKMRSPEVNNMERLRLVLLFALRYENETESIEALKAELRSNNIEQSQVDLVELLLRYGGQQARGGDLFGNKSMWNLGLNKLQKGLNFRGIENVYTQHTSLLKQTLDSLIKGKLRESDFPFAAPSSGASPKERPGAVVCFVIGGCTYEEARDVADLKKREGIDIILGGSCIHNSKSFLADVAQLNRGR